MPMPMPAKPALAVRPLPAGDSYRKHEGRRMAPLAWVRGPDLGYGTSFSTLMAQTLYSPVPLTGSRK